LQSRLERMVDNGALHTVQSRKEHRNEPRECIL
jgi:hypothetical protein